MRHADRLRSRGGFTLVELMVGLLIGALLITVVFQLLVGQTRVSGVQAAREEAQQNARGGMEILSSELRTVMPRGLLSAQAQSLTFMQPRGWGILCAGVTNATQIDVLFPGATPASVWTPSDATGILVRDNAGTWRPQRQATLAASLTARARVTAAQVLGAPGGAVCNGLGAQGNLQVVRLTSSVGLTATRGDLVAVYTLTQYDVASTGGALWLRRNMGMSAANTFNPQPLAGPIDPAPNSFTITYLDGAGNDLGVPGVNGTALDAVQQVRFSLTTRSSQQINGVPQRDNAQMTVLLRNNN